MLFAQPVFAYETGAMTCEDIGKYAGSLMSEREKGQKKEAAVAAIDTQEWQGEIERSNMAAIVDLIHGRVGNQLADAQAAYAIIKRDCDISKARQK
jgi:hypothetical protein